MTEQSGEPAKFRADIELHSCLSKPNLEVAFYQGIQVLCVRVITKYLSLHSRGETDVMDITGSVESAIRETRVKDGIVTVFVPGSTGALTTIEYESGLLRDFPTILDRIVPKHFDYRHGSNGHSHVRASIIGPSITVPFKDARLTLGTWQQLVFVELDIRHRSRDLVLQIMGE